VGVVCKLRSFSSMHDGACPKPMRLLHTVETCRVEVEGGFFVLSRRTTASSSAYDPLAAPDGACRILS